MTEFFGGITDMGRVTLDLAEDGELQLGDVKIGSASRTNAVIDNSVTDFSGNLELHLDVTFVFYTPFGEDRLVIFVELEDEIKNPIDVGNVMFYLSDGTPFAWGAFERTVRKNPAGPDSGGDWFVLALNLQYEGIFNKFNLNPNYSTEFSLDRGKNENAVIETFNQNRRFSAMADAFTRNFNIPGYMFRNADLKWSINPMFDVQDSDFTRLSGGTVGDRYDRTIG